MKSPESTNRSPARGLAAGLLICAWACLLLPSAPATANPLPEAVLFFHVQPVDPLFCATNTITTCDQIVQYTGDTGLLEFDLFVMQLVEPLDTVIFSLQTVLQWTPGWTLMDWEFCHDGIGTVDVAGDEALVDITWWGCPQQINEVFLAARFVVDVTGHGHFGQLEFLPSTLVLRCPPEEFILQPFTAPAEAGVECAYCFQPCDFSSPCNPQPDPTVIDLTLVQGQTAQRWIDVPISGGDYVWPCPVTFVCTEDWMTVEAAEVEFNHWLLTLTVDTAGLPTGPYEGWVRMEDQCVGCTRVNLQVLTSTGVPDENGHFPTGEPPVQNTWGQMKALYR